jgi:hypothetical protein
MLNISSSFKSDVVGYVCFVDYSNISWWRRNFMPGKGIFRYPFVFFDLN